jgi:methyl acetate hydrolase
MSILGRRQFSSLLGALAIAGKRVLAVTSLDQTLHVGMDARKIPALVAMVSTTETVLYSGAFGKRDDSEVKIRPDSIFDIASMTKAITSTAAMQLVEQGKVSLDEAAGKYLPQLRNIEVLEGFDEHTRKPILRPARKAVTLRHLLTHTSGFAGPGVNALIAEYVTRLGTFTPDAVMPLVFEPGERWHYGASTDWVGRLVEMISGQSLEQYFQVNILGPLRMKDTSYLVEPEKFARLVSTYERQSDGNLKQDVRKLPAPPQFFRGSQGLYSTAGDYTRFMQMILRSGRGEAKEQILRPETVQMMATNQIGNLSAGKMKLIGPGRPPEAQFHPGFVDGFGLGFLINATAYEGGRSAGSLAWAGGYNTFYWLDPQRKLCAVLLMQFHPFFDPQAIAMLNDFEHAVYATLEHSAVRERRRTNLEGRRFQ